MGSNSGSSVTFMAVGDWLELETSISTRDPYVCPHCQNKKDNVTSATRQGLTVITCSDCRGQFRPRPTS